MTTTTATQQRPARPRTTLPLKGTTRACTLHLDHGSDLAVVFAQCWLQRAGSLKVPASGVVRRAMALYVAHLESHHDARSEARAVERACKVLTPDAEDQQAAWKRLEAVLPGSPLPPYAEVLHGPHQAHDWAAFNDRAEALAADILASRKARTTRPPINPA